MFSRYKIAYFLCLVLASVPFFKQYKSFIFSTNHARIVCKECKQTLSICVMMGSSLML